LLSEVGAGRIRRGGGLVEAELSTPV